MEWVRKEQQGSYAKHSLSFDTEQHIQHLRQDEQYSALIDSVIEAAAATPADRRDKAILLALDIIEQLMVVTNMPRWQSSAVERAEKPAAPYAYWHHIDFSTSDLLAAPVKIDDVLEIIADYCRLPFRVAQLDRLLLDMAIVGELLASGQRQPGHAGNRLARRLTSHWTKIGLLCAGAVIAGGVVWWTAATTRPVAHGAAVAVGLIGLGVIMLAVRRASRRRPELDCRLGANAEINPIYLAYCTLAAGQTSVNELEEAVEVAKERGIVWSPGLIDLLDDILARRTTI